MSAKKNPRPRQRGRGAAGGTWTGFATRNALVVCIIVAVGVFGLLRPSFLSLGNFLTIGRQTAVIAVIAFAMTAVILARGIDISVGSTVAVSGVSGALLLEAGLPAPAAMAAIVLVGAGIGALNGVLIGFIGISPFMATLATLAFGRGAALSLSGASSIPVGDPAMLFLGAARIGTVPVALLVAGVCLLGWMFVLRRTVYGRWLYAVGGNGDAARASLVPARFTQFSTYVLVGAFAGLGAVITIGRLGSAQPLAGTGLEFAAITAAIIGGTKLSGGEGTITGTALGAVLVGVIDSGLSFMQAPQQLIYLVTGGLILVAVLLNQRAELAAVIRHGRQSLGRTPTAARTAVDPARRSVRLEGVSKGYPGVQALDDVSMELRAGEVVALAGENGAGKSTLVKVLAGVHLPDRGQVLIDGHPARFRSPEDARAAGISVIHQHFSLVPELTVTENLFLGRELVWPGTGALRRRAMRRRAAELIDELELGISPDATVSGLTVGQRQMVEVAKALLGEAWLVVMDEPTSALSNRERDHLFALVRRLVERHIGVLYISHKMEEIFTLSQRAVVLRDGTHVGEAAIEDVDESQLISMMVGRQVENIFPHVDAEPGDAPVLEIEHVGDGGLLVDAGLTVRPGEIVALAGLMGSGRSEVLRCVAGLNRPVRGRIVIAGDEAPPGDARFAAGRGVAFVPEDRHLEGFIPAMTVRDNLTLVWTRRNSRAGITKPDAIESVTRRMIDQLGVRPPDPGKEARLLSGGNQQKVVLGKWLATDPRILLLDEPTRGVDVGAKAELHRLIAGLKAEGVAILMVSSELPEVLNVADRIVVMHAGRSVGELTHGVTEQEVMELAFGRAPAAADGGARDGQQGTEQSEERTTSG